MPLNAERENKVLRISPAQAVRFDRRRSLETRSTGFLCPCQGISLQSGCTLSNTSQASNKAGFLHLSSLNPLPLTLVWSFVYHIRFGVVYIVSVHWRFLAQAARQQH